MKQILITILFLLVFLQITFPQQDTHLPDIHLLNQMNQHKNKYDEKVLPEEIIYHKKINEPASVNQTFYVDAVYVYRTNEEQRVIYSYNSDGIKTETLTQKLNGTQWVNFQRISNLFNSQGKLLNYIYELWQNNQWFIQLRSTTTYNSNGQAIQLLVEQAVNNQLTNSSRKTYTYNNNYIAEVINQNWQNNNWVNYSKDIFINDSQGNHLSDTYQLWQNSSWNNDQRFLSTYDGNSNLLLIITELWDNGWKNGFRETNTYDSNGNGLTSLNEKWDTNFNIWVGELRNSASYNASNNITQQTYEIYDFTEWRYKDRYTYSYDANENLISNLYEAWLNGQWSNWGFYGYTYDINNNLLTSIYQLWNNGAWENVWKQSYQYDSNNNLTTGNYYSWINSSWTPADGSLIFRDDGNNSFGFYGFKITVVYKNSPTYIDTEKVALTDYLLSQNYPNPFNPSTSIKYTITSRQFVQLKVYVVLGNEVATLVDEEKPAGSYEVEFNASKLSSGVYFYKIQAGSYVETKKMILIK